MTTFMILAYGSFVGVSMGMWIGSFLESRCWKERAKNGQCIVRDNKFYRVIHVHSPHYAVEIKHESD